MSFLPDLSVIASIYRGEKFLASFLEDFRNQTIFPRAEIVLILNEPSPNETLVTKDFAAKYPNQTQVLTVNRVETLGASWNRGWQAARAPFLAIWNVDDRRAPDSLDRQLAALEQNPGWELCYGDYVAVPAHGERGALRYTPVYSRTYFRRAFAQGGAFWVFRRSLATKLGFFDEQFEVAADMDFSFRIAEAGIEMGRIENVLGYFLNAEQGLSTRGEARRSAIERTVVQLRYGVYDKVKPEYLKETTPYRVEMLKINEEWQPLTAYLPRHTGNLRFRRPLWWVGRTRTVLRSFFGWIGIMRWLYWLQEKIWKREI